MTFAEISALSDEQLVHTELQTERELLASSFRLKTGQLENTASLSVLRKQIARLRTAQRQRELEAGLAVDTLRNRYRGSFQAAAAQAAGGTAGGFVKGFVDKVGAKD